MTARAAVGAIRRLRSKTGWPWRRTCVHCWTARTFRVHFVLVGHSSGAEYVRIFAGRYPELVAGMVLLDGQPAEAFEGLLAYPAFYNGFRRISALFPTLARVGVGRLVVHADYSLPRPARDIQRLHHASPRLYRSLRDEFAELPTSLAQARSFQNVGDRPLVVVTAARDALAGLLPLQDSMATLSPGCRPGGRPGVSRTTSAPPPASPGSYDTGL